MKLIWDEVKRQSNIQKHGLDFADLDYEFFSKSFIVSAKARRKKAVGYLKDRSIAVIYIELGSEAFSIISMRPASIKERQML